MLVKLRFLQFSDFQVQPSGEIVRVHCAKCCIKLRFPLSKRNPLRRSRVSTARNVDAETLKGRSCTRDPGAEISHKWSYRTLIQTSWQRDLAQEIHIQRSCTSGHTRSWRRVLTQRYAQEIRVQQRSCTSSPVGSCWGDLDTDILHKRSSYTDLPVLLQDPGEEILDTLLKRSSYRDLPQEVPQDPDAKFLTQRSCARDHHTEILHKRSYRTLMPRSWHRHLAQEFRIQSSCTSGPTGF